MDLLAATGVEEDDEGKADREIQRTEAGAAGKEVHDQHLPVSILLAGIKDKTLHQGHFTNQYNYLEFSTVAVPAFQRPVLIVYRVMSCASKYSLRVSGDRQETRSLRGTDDDTGDEEDEEGEEVEDDIPERERRKSRLEAQQEEERLKRQQERQPTGRVIGIIERNWLSYAISTPSPGTSTSRSLTPLLAIPTSPLLPRIRIRTRQAPSLIGQKLLVAIDTWPANKRNPEGHLVRRLGAGDKDTEQESLMLEFDVVYAPFGKRAMECLPEEDEILILLVVRILMTLYTPAICRMAISRPVCTSQMYRTSFSLIYLLIPRQHPEESVYLVDKRVDMLPALLGANLCSLRPHVETLAFSAIWELTPDADIVNVRFTKSVIASKAAFTYEEAQICEDDPHLQDERTTGICLLKSLAIKLKAMRMAAGALNLASPEVKIHLDIAESSDPIDVEQNELWETNSLVEEFMLLANVSVAQKVQETFPQTAVLQRQMPPKGNFERLQDILLKRKGSSLDVSDSSALAASLDLCLDPSEPAFNTLRYLRPLRSSESHRYADVLAYRQLVAAIDYTTLHPSLHSAQNVDRILDVVNRRHRMAQMASYASVKFYVGLALKQRGEAENEAGAGRSLRDKDLQERRRRRRQQVWHHRRRHVQTRRDGVRRRQLHEINPNSKGTGNVDRGVFDKVTVLIEVEKDKNTQRGKVNMTLVRPVDSSDL
ncbi:hypothetical protein AB1N83_008445 [Pleurotus pulmonarius]